MVPSSLPPQGSLRRVRAPLHHEWVRAGLLLQPRIPEPFRGLLHASAKGDASNLPSGCIGRWASRL
eukprot:3144290-Alexandrium_andersonii.AAC.1